MTLSDDDLLAPFTGGEQQLLGTESEKFGILRESGAPVSYDGRECGILNFFQELVDRHRWEEVREYDGGPVIALERIGATGRVASVTLEPGAQLELSGEAVETVHEVASELDNHLREIAPCSDACGVLWLASGYHPVASGKLPWVPKQRYAIMREYFPSKGSRGLDMMRRTATVQVNVDYRDHEDAMRKMRVGLALAPVATAIFANSPFAEGRLNGKKSERAVVWLDVDPDRTGLLPQLWSRTAKLRDYVEWALDVPMYLFKRDGEVVANTGQSFRSFMDDGYEGHRPTADDWLSHLGTVFPEARLKKTIELRSVDSLPRHLLPAMPALWAGIMYDDAALAGAEALIAGWTPDQVQISRADIATRGLQATINGEPVRATAERLVQLALDGLARRARLDADGQDERVHLQPVVDLVSRGRCPADELLEGLDTSDPAALRAQIIESSQI